MNAKPEYLMQCWYVAAMSSEVDETGTFRRKIMGSNIMFYRNAAGEPIAMQDRCPHRFVPLSMGRREEDVIVCPYHGLKFDGAGHCVHNPHGRGQLPKGPVVRTYPLIEKYGFIWIWMAEEEADFDLLPDFSPLDKGPSTGIGHTYMNLKVDYRLILDNVMDLSHIDHIHGEIITTRGKLSPLIPAVKEAATTISARWEWEQQPALLIFNQFLPRPEDVAQHFIQVNWSAPANIQLSVAAVQDSTSFEDGAGQYDLHSCTPEDDYSTHYFFATRRDHVEDDAAYNEIKISAMHDAFLNEDGPVMMACQEEMGEQDFFDMNPMLLSNDLAAVKVRRQLKKLIDAERMGALKKSA